MSFLRNHPQTITHPKIVTFLKDCQEISQGQPITLEQVQSSPIIRYSHSLIILAWQEDKQDFLYKYWGSHLTEVYGMDLTGGCIADGDHKQHENPFILAHKEVIETGKNLYLGGTIDWRDKDHQTWNQVIQPLSRHSKIQETLTFVTFE